MANVLVQDSSLTAIGNAIREKNGSSTTYKPAEMAAAISAIATGGSSGGITQWGKLYYSSSTAKLDLSSIVSDYSKIDFIIMLKDSTSSNTCYIYFPNLEPVSSVATEYIPLLQLTTSNTSYYSAYGSRGYFVGPADYTKETTYYFKKSEFEANQPLTLYYLTTNGTKMSSMSMAVSSNYSVLVFYHD